ncbi:serine O-acetyltransferase EpsC [Spongiivirga citrea]|uniref:Serine acetyltransferase n=1 Tax=Spongiivirga citrea TaxID=1481457 RepID=A0A6M0CG39_9FLAO|nr:serine O-acetyltransferase EpsC [Spongiivirga citrea]NER16422.1 serine acetyltransferase [Spongiivirga citrea]
MSSQQIIEQIKKHKQQPNLNFQLKITTEQFTEQLFSMLFNTQTDVEETFEELSLTFSHLVSLACWDINKPCHEVWDTYIHTLPAILQKLNLDATAIVENDPAAKSIEEVYMAYPGFLAIAIYRLSHELYKLGFPLVPRLMTEYAHRETGVDINPGASIGDSFFIDHATGVVIGETTIIKNNVKLYQGVTLGALYVSKELENTKRHPTVEDNVTIYANATILGGETIIGANSIIGGNVWITESIPANSIVSHTPEIRVKTQVNE